MNITREIQKEEMKVRNLIKDWHQEKLEDFILDLIKRRGCCNDIKGTHCTTCGTYLPKNEKPKR